MLITVAEIMLSFIKNHHRLWIFYTLSKSFHGTEFKNVYLI